MPLQVAVQMDPLERVNIETDTTFFLMLEAQTRGHGLWHFSPDRLATALFWRSLGHQLLRCCSFPCRCGACGTSPW